MINPLRLLGDTVSTTGGFIKDFFQGMGGGWKWGLAAGVGAAALGALGIVAITPAAAIGIGVVATAGAGVVGGTVNAVKGLFSSPLAEDAVQASEEFLEENLNVGKGAGNLSPGTARDEALAMQEREGGGVGGP